MARLTALMLGTKAKMVSLHVPISKFRLQTYVHHLMIFA